MRLLANKIALITGGANGIGKAASLKFANEGASVIIADIDEDNGKTLVSRITNLNQHAIFVKCDVSKSQDVRNTIGIIEQKYGILDVIYNNASVYLSDSDAVITNIEEHVWEKVININLRSIYLFCKYGIPLMVKRGSGSIINTSSSAGLIGIPKCDAYTASKGATISLTRSLAVEFGPKGIRTNCIAPAAVQTDMMNKSNLDEPDYDEENFLNLRAPLRRYGNPEEIANLAAFLASDFASYINGAIIPVDGGITINGDLSKLKTFDLNQFQLEPHLYVKNELSKKDKAIQKI
ncbi:MAG TPA: short-chain dehydrogenase [Phycisphaerales bacterium]|nr:short-chain dehydrogenase [Phycisphaerales bacterium]